MIGHQIYDGTQHVIRVFHIWQHDWIIERTLAFRDFIFGNFIFGSSFVRFINLQVNSTLTHSSTQLPTQFVIHSNHPSPPTCQLICFPLTLSLTLNHLLAQPPTQFIVKDQLVNIKLYPVNLRGVLRKNLITGSASTFYKLSIYRVYCLLLNQLTHLPTQ